MSQWKNDKLFCQSYPLVLHVEGGFVDDPKDPGGPTNHGIAWNFNVGALQAIGITRATMADLTKDQALQIYYEKYWLAAGCEKITDEGLAYIHFDTAVNCGVGAASKMIRQLTVNPHNFDGAGDKNEVLFLRLVMEYAILRLDYYTDLRAELKRAYLEGWINRMEFVIGKAKALV